MEPLVCTLISDGIHLVENLYEQNAISTIRGLRAAGFSFRAIARELDRLGIPTKSGRMKWSGKVVSGICERAA